MKGRKSHKIVQNKIAGKKQEKKLTKSQAILETMSVMNEEIRKLSVEMNTLMNFNATILEVAEHNGLFSTQDVLQLMNVNVKNSSVYQQVMAQMDKEVTDDIEGLSEILGKQLYDHNLDRDDIRKDIIDFPQFYKGDNIDELIAKSEEYRRDLAARQLQEDKEKDDKDNAGSAG